MRTKERISTISVIVLLCLCQQVHCQSQGNWDRALDRYELICERCIELLELKRSGIDVAQESLSSLLTQLSLLKSSLNEADKQMSPAQKMRFDMIRRRFATIQTGNHDSIGFSKEAISVRTGENGTKATAKQVPTPKASISDTLSASSRHLSPALPCISCTFPNKVTAIHQPVHESIVWQPLDRASVPVASSGSIFEIMAGLQAGAYPSFNLGSFVAFCIGKFGFYLKGRTDLAGKAPDYSFSLNSDGTIEGGGKMWSEGGQLRKRAVATAGALFKVGPIAFYAGAGYGNYRCFMEGPNEQWGLVSDLSAKGLSVDAGLMTGIGNRFFAGIGACATGFRYSELEVTLGLRFGNTH